MPADQTIAGCDCSALEFTVTAGAQQIISGPALLPSLSASVCFNVSRLPAEAIPLHVAKCTRFVERCIRIYFSNCAPSRPFQLVYPLGCCVR